MMRFGILALAIFGTTIFAFPTGNSTKSVEDLPSARSSEYVPPQINCQSLGYSSTSKLLPWEATVEYSGNNIKCLPSNSRRDEPLVTIKRDTIAPNTSMIPRGFTCTAIKEELIPAQSVVNLINRTKGPNHGPCNHYGKTAASCSVITYGGDSSYSFAKICASHTVLMTCTHLSTVIRQIGDACMNDLAKGYTAGTMWNEAETYTVFVGRYPMMNP